MTTRHSSDYIAPTDEEIAAADEMHDTRRALEFRWIPVLVFWGLPLTVIGAYALYRMYGG